MIYALSLQGAIGGLITGISLSFWVGVGSFIYPASSNNTHPLELNTAGCNFSMTADGSNQTLLTISTPIPYRCYYKKKLYNTLRAQLSGKKEYSIKFGLYKLY